VLPAPTGVRLWPGKIREPDILFVTREHADRIQEDMIYGAPDLVAEILSPGTEATDRREKFDEYQQAGVSEYWIVDPETSTVTVYALTEGVYEPQGAFGSGEMARSTLLKGFEIAVDEIFKPQFTGR
jgi:Uma2 family endonuclease